MKNKIKIVFFDIDGTLIDMNRKKISEKTVEALTRLKENGVILCVATGRGPFGLPHFEGIEFDAFLTFNGSYCFQKQQDIFSNPISKEDAKQIIQNAAFINRPVSIATRNSLSGKNHFLVGQGSRYYSKRQWKRSWSREDSFTLSFG